MNSEDTYEVFALRYATRDARRREHFLNKDRVVDPEASMPMDYLVWLIRNQSRTLLVDTGFSEPVGTRRGRTHLRSPADALKLLRCQRTPSRMLSSRTCTTTTPAPCATSPTRICICRSASCGG